MHTNFRGKNFWGFCIQNSPCSWTLKGNLHPDLPALIKHSSHDTTWLSQTGAAVQTQISPPIQYLGCAKIWLQFMCYIEPVQNIPAHFYPASPLLYFFLFFVVPIGRFFSFPTSPMNENKGVAWDPEATSRSNRKTDIKYPVYHNRHQCFPFPKLMISNSRLAGGKESSSLIIWWMGRKAPLADLSPTETSQLQEGSWVVATVWFPTKLGSGGRAWKVRRGVVWRGAARVPGGVRPLHAHHGYRPAKIPKEK